MQKRLGKGKKLTLGALAMLGGLYVVNPKIQPIQHATQKELIKTFQGCEQVNYTHKDLETTQILDLISGKISVQSLHDLLLRHGYEKSQLDTLEIWPADEALYQTIWEMHSKYGMPEVKFSGNFKNYEVAVKNIFRAKQEDIYEHGRPHYHPGSNSMHLHNLDSAKLTFENKETSKNAFNTLLYHQTSTPDMRGDLYKNTQHLLLNAWISELAHSVQAMNQKFSFREGVHTVIDYVRTGFDQQKMYHVPGMMEYEAHSVIEPRLIKEFITLYEKYSQPLDQDSYRNLARFCSGYFPHYFNEDKSYTRLTQAANAGNPEAAYILGEQRWVLCWKTYEYDFIASSVEREKQTREYFDQMLHRLELSVANGSTHQAEIIIKIMQRSLEYKMCPERGIYRGERYLKNEHYKKNLAAAPAIWHYLAQLYLWVGQQQASQEATQKVIEHGGFDPENPSNFNIYE